MSKRTQEEDEFGLISRNEAVKEWALNTPRCPKCGFFVTLSYSGPVNEVIWPICSNKKCSLHTCETFINAGTPDKDAQLLLKKARKEQAEDLFKGPEEIKK